MACDRPNPSGRPPEGFGRIRYYQEVRQRLDSDPPFRRYFEQESTELPEFFVAQVRKDLGPLWDSLPPGALEHDPDAYAKSEARPTTTTLRTGVRPVQ